eukprot:m.23300 g.23300  ORF g.23300 m.23300 type:complete len:928 (+) comp7487_c0_seq1:63-2846(+)
MSTPNALEDILEMAWSQDWSEVRWGLEVQSLVDSYPNLSQDLCGVLFRHGSVGSNPPATIVSYMWHALGSRLIHPIDCLKMIGSLDSKFGNPKHPYHFALLLDLLKDSVGSFCHSYATVTTPEQSLTFACDLLEGLTLLVEQAGVCFEESDKSASSIENKNLYDRNGNSAVHISTLLIASTQVGMLITIGRYQQAGTWQNLEDMTAKLPDKPACSEFRAAMHKTSHFVVLRDKQAQCCALECGWKRNTTPVSLTTLAFVEAARTMDSPNKRVGLWAKLMRDMNVPLAEVLHTLWTIGLTELLTVPEAERMKWACFVSIRVPALVGGICEALGEVYSTIEDRSVHASRALRLIKERAVRLLVQAGELLNCNMESELKSACVELQLMTLQEAPSEQKLLRHAECTEALDKIKIDEENVDWSLLCKNVEDLQKGNFQRLFEGLNAWGSLPSFHQALTVICGKAVAATPSSLEIVKCYSMCRILTRYIEVKFAIKSTRAEWAQDCPNLELAKQIMKSIQEQSNRTNPLASIPDFMLLESVAKYTSGLLSLVGAGQWIGLRLIYAESQSTMKNTEFETWIRIYVEQLPCAALDTMEWLLQGLQSGVSTDESLARFRVFVRLFIATKRKTSEKNRSEVSKPHECSLILLYDIIASLSKLILEKCSKHLKKTDLVEILESDEPTSESAGTNGILALKQSSLPNMHTTVDLLRASRVCGPSWLAKAALGEITRGSGLPRMVRVSEVASTMFIAQDEQLIRQASSYFFTETLPESCQQITKGAQGVALARFSLRVTKAILCCSDQRNIPLKSTKRRRLSSSDNCNWPAKHLGLLVHLMVELLNTQSSPAQVLSFSFAQQSQSEGPAGLFPHSEVGEELRPVVMKFAKALRLYGHENLARPFFDLTTKSGASDAAAFFKLQPIPKTIRRPTPYLPSI